MNPMSTKADFLYEACRSEILSGSLPPGSRIQQEDLAARLGASITPLREAIRRLQVEGLVVTRAHSDAHVAPLSQTEIQELYETRKPLDGLSAAQAAAGRTSDQLARMERALSEIDKRPDAEWSDVVVLNYEFHRALWQASNNSVLIAILESIWSRCERYRRLGAFINTGGIKHDKHQREHHELFRLISAGDSDGAAALMASHTQSTLDDLRAQISETTS